MPIYEVQEDGAFASSEFRGSNRKRLLKGLFYETTLSDKTNVKYSLKDEDHLGFPSLSRLYLEAHDPTEYKFAVKYLESWDHWLALCACNWFTPYLEKMRTELEAKMKSEALANIIVESRNPKSPSRFTANKFIIDRGWVMKDEPGAKRGRPNKDEIRKAAHEIADEAARVQEDYDRLINKSVN